MYIVTDAELAEHRADALDRMTSRCVIGRKAAAPVQDETNGVDVFPWTKVHTDLPLRLGGASRDSSAWTIDTRAGGVQESIAERIASLPWDTTDLQDGDVIAITAGENAGLFFQITEATNKDQATARRVPVKQILKPEGWDY
jgi:hypothetical protein